MTTDDEVIVVGGGIGGLAAALALATSGLAVRVLERAPQFAEVGAGLQVGPNAVRALDHLGLLEPIYALAVFPEHGRIASAVTGQQLTRIDLGQPMADRFGYPYLVLHRNDVLSTLLEAARRHPRVELENDRTLTQVIDEGQRVRLHCEDGAERTARLVVGADGINSMVRTKIRRDEPVFSGCIAYRGTVPIDEVDAAHRTDDVRLWIGPDLHLMQYPVRRGELYNQVAVFRSRRWFEGRADWGTPEELVERFSDATDIVLSAIPALSTAAAYPNYDKEPLDTFVHGRSVLIGDAAHPMLQYLGQGACMALEDALVLAGALGGDVREPWDALRAYDAARVPRTTRCQRIARPWGESWHTEDEITVAYRDRHPRTRRSDDFTDVEWLYDDVLTHAGHRTTEMREVRA